MSLRQPSNVYREQLSSLNHGLALWDPKPVDNLYNHISIGDVGYLLGSGTFMRLFNVTLPWDDPSNRLLQVPEEYKHLELGYLINVHSSETREREYCSHVSKVDNNYANTHAEAMGQMYECQAQTHGALLFLPHGSHSEDVLRTKVFEGYIKDNVDSWLRWSRRGGFPIERMDDLILVTGCTLTTSWAAAVFGNSKASMTGSVSAAISLDSQKLNRGGGQFFWHNSRGNVDYRNSYFDPTVEGPVPRNQCVFFRGFRARRIFFRTRPMRAEAEPLPDDPDNRRDDEIQVTRIPDDSKEHRDPLVVILDYIEEKCQEDTMAKDIEEIVAIAHDDDLQLFEDIEIVTADTIESFLREKKMPLLIENGVAILSRFPVPIGDRAEPPALGHSNSASHKVLPPNVGAVFATALLDAMRKQYPSSKETQGDEKLNQARELVTSEVRTVVTEHDLEVIEHKFNFAREMKVGLNTKSGFRKFLHAREYHKAANGVYRHVKRVSDRAYDRFQFQSPPVTSLETEDIYRTARSLYLCWLSCKEAFPPSLTQDRWVVDAWNEACYRTGANPNLLRQDGEIKCDSMKLFTDIKTKIKHNVDSLYEFDTSPAADSISNVRRAQALLDETTFIYLEPNVGGLPRYPYRHPIIQKVVNVTWFQDKDDIGIIFHDYFSPIPFEAIALVLTVIECCIGEWTTGTYQESSWKEVDYKANYLSHLNSLLDIRNRSLQHRKGRDILRQIQDDLLKAAREHAGVPPVPTTGTGKLSVNAIDAAIEDDFPKYDSD